MRKTKNVFLTILSETKDRLDVNYYVCDSGYGDYTYTTGISIAEAGIKYALSNHHIDEIIMIGSAAKMSKAEMMEANIDKVQINNITDLDRMSEFSFLNYRIAEYMMQVDFELLDIGEPVSEDRKEEIKKQIVDFKNTHVNTDSSRELFFRLCTDSDFEKDFSDEILSKCTREEQKWIKYHLYSEMDSFYKMHLLEENKKTTLKFIPIENKNGLSIEDINSIVRKTFSGEKADINLMMDIQGLGAIDGNTLISTFLLLNRKTGFDCRVKGLINSHISEDSFSGVVSNAIKSYEIQNLISGLDIFLKYGKVDMLKTYWKSLDIDNPDADSLFYGMDCIDEGISLCNVDLIGVGIDVIRHTFQEPKVKAENRDIYLEIMMNAIAQDYGALLEGDELSIPELLKWCHRKKLYQQTLTIIESKVPVDMVKRGIYYYARDEKDIKEFMKELNYLYWNEVVKMRWAFNDIEHFFIKQYGRAVLDYRQKPDMITKDFAKLRVAALHEDKEVTQILPAYSELNNDALLYELFLGYYRIGNLRNQVNHAVVDAPDMDSLTDRKDARDELDVALGKFINLYYSACLKTKKQNEPRLLPSGRMKAYSRQHQLAVLEEDTSLTAKNTYSCSFNGKEVLINISLFKPEDDNEIVEDDEEDDDK